MYQQIVEKRKKRKKPSFIKIISKTEKKGKCCFFSVKLIFSAFNSTIDKGATVPSHRKFHLWFFLHATCKNMAVPISFCWIGASIFSLSRFGWIHWLWNYDGLFTLWTTSGEKSWTRWENNFAAFDQRDIHLTTMLAPKICVVHSPGDYPGTKKCDKL